ncbi:MAG: sulfotransferase [Desulfamplus sp.]|nr:sulfotransferase [Desulfamplus sp.]
MSSKQQDPFFIVGNSRSGTTLLSRILKNHSFIHVLNETHFFEEFSSQIHSFKELNDDQLCKLINTMITIQRKDYYRKSEYEEYPDEAENILKQYAQVEHQNFETLNNIFFTHEALRLGKKRAGDQTPRHVLYIDEIFTIYPEAKVIHMIRDPRAVLFSQKRKWLSGYRNKQPLFEVIRTFFNYHPFTMTILWCKSVNAGLSAEKNYGEQRIKKIYFEQFVDKPEFYIKEICQFLGENYENEMLDVTVELSATENLEGKKGVVKDISEQWKKRLKNGEVFICQKIAGNLMEKLGYIPSINKTNWFQVVLYILWLPLHLGIAFLLNLGRMGNPIKFIIKRLA